MGHTWINTDFWPVFVVNRRFRSNQRLTPLGFDLKLDIFQNLKTIVYNNIMSNRARIWASRG
jgi:hypothetical protein